jgi:hypothetical protein
MASKRLVASIALIPLALGADDGVAITPPLGWRDWNAYGGNINQEIMVSTMIAMAAPFPGTNISLKSLGFKDVGLVRPTVARS